MAASVGGRWKGEVSPQLLLCGWSSSRSWEELSAPFKGDASWDSYAAIPHLG